jgi:CBS domain containing-hemolysin-like protein
MVMLIGAVTIVLVSSGLCSGTEAALFSVPIISVRRLAEEKRRGAKPLLQIRGNMSRPIATVVILNNIANIVGSITVGGIAASVLGDAWVGVFSAVLTFLVIVFSEIIPKTLGERYCMPIALAAARPVQILTFLMTPIVWLIEHLTAPITKGQVIPTTNEAEIRMLAAIGGQEGIIEQDESEMIQRVFRMNDLTAGDLMTPRVAMTSLSESDTLAEAQEAIIESPHSRIVVVGDSPDDVKGMAFKSRLLIALIEARNDRRVADFVHETHFVPQYVRADRLLLMFQESRRHLAVVIDEFGGVAGVVSLEDVLETLTGEIVDETDHFVDLRATARRRGRAALDAQQ